jgi:hypothetical protein
MFKDELSRNAKLWLICVLYIASKEDDCSDGNEAYSAIMKELGL